MEPITIAVAGAVTTLAASVLTYLGTRGNTKKDMFVTDRQQLSKDQQDLRQEMREELKYWRERYDKMAEQMEVLSTSNIQLQAEVMIWKEKYEHLHREYTSQTRRLNELEDILRKR